MLANVDLFISITASAFRYFCSIYPNKVAQNMLKNEFLSQLEVVDCRMAYSVGVILLCKI